MIAIVDYGVGNVQALHTVYRRRNIDVVRATTPEMLREASRLILPGVGAFDIAMRLLMASGLRDELRRRVVEDGVPVLGICVGMQMLMAGSDEGREPGLGWIPGRVRSFRDKAPAGLLVPHLGWNTVSPKRPGGLFEGLGPDPRFYFLHSYYVACDEETHVAAWCDYGRAFPCAVSRGHIHGVQFHPEKSHEAGVRLLTNFAGSASC